MKAKHDQPPHRSTHGKSSSICMPLDRRAFQARLAHVNVSLSIPPSPDRRSGLNTAAKGDQILRLLEKMADKEGFSEPGRLNPFQGLAAL